ncbi:hypothetical protein HL658_03590 [Azospirillum sp. RWY-5-1]|uniref:Uncharacterized protein n=1 Tax=Azospirillum oleiclasticum TaxID=2735135 RepID=A0ABX2T3R1_9PROT|nr:hypothetical protein [Azospirillum oleiclasticum]NYZ11620.1 hypothetical protein [Azospirillum oleiclasticum]NYZ18781.1 hypothetical protein [Azospirillum oleiclasticum]
MIQHYGCTDPQVDHKIKKFSKKQWLAGKSVHMMYTRAPERARLAADARALVEAASR